MGVAGTVAVVVATLLVGAGGFFTWANRATRRVHAAFGPKDVEAALRCVLDDSHHYDDFDLFLAWPIDDPYLESIRKRCDEIVRTSPPPKPGENLSENGKERIREILRDLQERT